MNQTHPDAAPSRLSDAPDGRGERAETPGAEVQSKGDVEVAAVAAAREAGEVAEGDLQAMTEHVMDKADLEAGTCFGVSVPLDMLPVGVACLLCQLKKDKGLPVETLPDAIIGPLLKLKLTEASEQEAALQDQAEANGKAEANQAHADWAARFSTNSEAVMAAETLETGGNPKLEAEKGRLLSFKKILTIAQLNKEDGKRIAAAMNAMDFAGGGLEPITFIQQVVFSSPERDSGISDETQAAIATEFGLTARSVVTGSDVQSTLGATTTGPDGKPRPAYTKADPLEYRPGINGYADDAGRQYVMASSEHETLPPVDVTNWPPEDVGRLSELMQLWAMTENAGVSGFLGPMLGLDANLTGLQHQGELRRSAQIVNALLGQGEGYDGDIFYGPDELAQIQWQAQIIMPKGDAARSDFDKTMADDALQALQIKTKGGQIDVDVLNAFGDYSRREWGAGAPDADAVREFLAGQFPDKFKESEEGA